jgi:hypothetical protein
MTSKTVGVPIAASLFLVACATAPTGPSVMVLPGGGKSFDQFIGDDALCRQWAAQQAGTTPQKVATEGTVAGAAGGTAIGAAAGAAIGAASGSPATGAAVGAGVGLVGGTAAGASYGQAAGMAAQQRYDIAYMQCMYVKGNQIPVPGGTQQPPEPAWVQPPRTRAPVDVPPPPPGNPPPPPPGPSW